MNLLLLALGGVWTFFGITAFFQRPDMDFHYFFNSGHAWLAGADPYAPQYPNLQPPVLLLVFGPLAALPLIVAKIVWLGASAAALIASWRLVVRTLGLSRAASERLVGLAALSYPSFLVWWGGQPIWLLCYPSTCAWVAYREGRARAAGLWLVPLILFKPQFALAVLLLSWRVWLPAGVASAGLSLVSMLVTGLEPWRQWLALGGRVRWLSFMDNASGWGATTRLQSASLRGGALSDVDVPVVVALVVLLAAGAVLVLLTADRDLRIARALVWGILAAPIGWICYLPVAGGPLIASWHRGRLSDLAVAIWLFPLPIIAPLMATPWLVISLGSIYCVGLLAWWLENPFRGS